MVLDDTLIFPFAQDTVPFSTLAWLKIASLFSNSAFLSFKSCMASYSRC